MSDEQNQVEDELQDDQVELSSASQAENNDNKNQEGEQGLEALQAEIESLKSQLTEAQENVLRAQAEVQNVRRRAELDVERAHKYGLEKFVSDMLPVADNLERAVAASADKSGDFTAVAEGVELTLKSLLDGLKRHNVEAVNPEGEPFNPEFHQAMSAVENADCEPNTVLNVFQCGYTLNGRLVRPAMVVVSKAPAQ